MVTKPLLDTFKGLTLCFEDLGKSIEDGKEDFKSLEAKVIDTPQAQLRAATQSDHLEEIKDTINHYMIETLAK